MTRQGGRRLVHNQELYVPAQRPADGNELLLSKREASDQGVEVDVKLNLFCGRDGLLSDLAPTHRSRAVGKDQRQNDVFRHRQIQEQRGILVDDLDAVLDGALRTSRANRIAVERYFPRVLSLHSGDDLDDR